MTRFQVFTRSGKLQLKGVETGDPALKGEIVTRTPGQFYEVVLRYAGGWTAGELKRSIRVSAG